MKSVCFFERIKHFKTGSWDKGVEIKEAETDKLAFFMAKQAFHAYLGAYAYGKDDNVDYVKVSISNRAGRELEAEKWDVVAEEEPVVEPTEVVEE